MQARAPVRDPLLSEDLDARARGHASRSRRARVSGHGPWGRLKSWLAAREAPDPLPAVLGVLEADPHGYGICCSGGGIRSAAFNLGALQKLQEEPHRVLQRAKYLAAVSGGAYIAAGFAMVAKFGEDGDSEKDLVTDPKTPPFHPGSPEEQYLRNRSSYMAPGFVGKLRLAGRVLLGVLVNLLLLGSLLFLLGWLLGAVVYGRLYPDLRDAGGDAPTTTAAYVALGLLAAVVVLGFAATLVHFEKEATRRALWAWAARLLALAAVTALLFVAVPAVIEWLREVRGAEPTKETAGGTAVAAGGGGTIAVLLAILAQLRVRMSESRLLARATKSGREGLSGYVSDTLLPRMRGALVLLAAAVAGPVLFTGILLASAVAGVVADVSDPWEWLPFVIAAVVFVVLCTFADVTAWSLHPFYRERLSSAFALRRVCDEQGRPIAERRPYGRPMKVSLSSVEAVKDEDKPWEWPQLVVCAAANVSDAGATPPGRAVTSFTFSPRAIGGPLIGTVATKEFERRLGARAQDFTLPAAVAMSGAALSPSMGKATRAPLRFLLTLGNARLGVWVPNPRRLPAKDLDRMGRLERWRWRPRPLLLINELLGRNSADARFLYVTDGGHYENLGLVELLRRGCRDVICLDASGGSDVQELGDAIALARTELGVEVALRPEDADALVPADSGVAEKDCVEGTIRFPGGHEGRLIYVRSVMTAKAAHDVRTYHEIDPAFPHNSTGDQLYTDQRFEAYRELGRGAAGRALAVFEKHDDTAEVPAPDPTPLAGQAAQDGHDGAAAGVAGA